MSPESDRVADAFAETPRAHFLRPGNRALSGINEPVSIGYGATNSQPTTVADMLRLLQVPVGARVLDVGAGSGWTTALLAHLVGPSGTVIGVELEPGLVQFGTDNLAAFNRTWAHIRQAVPGRLGDPDHGPYQRILVSAMADEIPAELVAQLAPEGIMVVPVAGQMLRVTASETGPIKVTTHGHYIFVPLR